MNRRWWLPLAGILAFGVVARLLYLRQFAALPFFEQPIGDSAAHLARAMQIADGRFLPERPFYYCSIFYPYFLALVRVLLGPSLVPVAMIQLMTGVLVAGGIALLTRSLFGARAGLVAGVIAVLYGPSAFLEADTLGVVWGQLAIVAGTLLCVAWSRPALAERTRTLLAVACGVAFGLAVVERPNLLSLAPVVALWMLRDPRSGRRWTGPAALCGGVVLPVLVVLSLNVAGTGQWVPLTTSAGINLSLGYHQGATGTYDEPWERESPEFSARHPEPEQAMVAWASARTGRTLTPTEASSYWMHQALDWIARHPREAAFLTFRKAALLLNATEISNHLDFEFIRERAPALWLMPLGFLVVLPVALVGLILGWRRSEDRRGVLLLALLAAAAWAAVVPFTVADRYRAPMIPPLIVLGAAGIAWTWEQLRATGAARRTLIVPLVAAALAAAVAAVPLVRPVRSRDHWMMAEAYHAHGDRSRAIAEYENAARIDPRDAAILNNLANAYREVGDRARAIATLRQAVAAVPALVYPHKNLGMTLIGAGEWREAEAELRTAARLDSADAETQAMLGALLAERGARAEAAVSFDRARRLAPEGSRIQGLIAHYTNDSAPTR